MGGYLLRVYIRHRWDVEPEVPRNGGTGGHDWSVSHLLREAETEGEALRVGSEVRDAILTGGDVTLGFTTYRFADMPLANVTVLVDRVTSGGMG